MSFGEVGIGHELVIGAEEEIFEMNNGCICCTVRGDLIRILGNLMKRRERFDYIMIETTCMADPGPVAQTFFMDDEIQTVLSLDGIVTLVDAKHVRDHIDDSDEVQEQIAFADVILLNKTDLVSSAQLDQLESRIRHMNSTARIHHTQDARIDMEAILHQQGFDLQRALEIDPRFLEPEYPFEWSGVYLLAAGNYTWMMQSGPDPAMSVCCFSLPDGTEAAMRRVVEPAVRVFSDDEVACPPGALLEPVERLYRLQLESSPATLQFTLTIPRTGHYALFTEHHPDEFLAALLDGNGQPVTPGPTREYKPDHAHDEGVTSVGITTPGALDLERFQGWLRELLATKGTDIFRMKGVLNFHGMAERYLFQGVHMLFDGKADRPWGHEPRHNTLIFIGRNLDRDELNAGFEACLV